MRLALDALDDAGKEEAIKELVKKPAQCTETQTKNGIQFTIDGVKFNMIKVDGGTFKMGAVNSKKAEKNEKPPPWAVCAPAATASQGASLLPTK
jgi:hypothetical protein